MAIVAMQVGPGFSDGLENGPLRVPSDYTATSAELQMHQYGAKRALLYVLEYD